MVLSFVVIFAICFFPSHFFFIWFYYYPDAEKDYNLFWHSFRMVGFCLSFINSCINPITLYCVSGTFRKVRNMFKNTLLSLKTFIDIKLEKCMIFINIYRKIVHIVLYIPTSVHIYYLFIYLF